MLSAIVPAEVLKSAHRSPFVLLSGSGVEGAKVVIEGRKLPNSAILSASERHIAFQLTAASESALRATKTSVNVSVISRNGIRAAPLVVPVVDTSFSVDIHVLVAGHAVHDAPITVPAICDVVLPTVATA